MTGTTRSSAHPEAGRPRRGLFRQRNSTRPQSTPEPVGVAAADQGPLRQRVQQSIAPGYQEQAPARAQAPAAAPRAREIRAERMAMAQGVTPDAAHLQSGPVAATASPSEVPHRGPLVSPERRRKAEEKARGFVMDRENQALSSREDRRLRRSMTILGPVLFGLLVVCLFSACALAWIALAPLDKGVTAFGRIIVETKAKNIQHPVGGKVAALLVRESQDVKKGQTLIRLDTEAFERQLAAARGQRSAATRQSELLAEETQAYEKLYARKLTPRSRVLQLQRQGAETDKELHRLEALIANLENEISQAVITAPSDGRVLRLAVFAAGEVIQPGGTVMQFVPKGEKLVLEARLRTADVAQVYSGMPASVWLTAFSRRETAPLQATVQWISPDSVSDPNGKGDYYVARLTLDDPSKVPGGPAALVPGMRAEILLVAGKKTILDQLFEPFSRALTRATSH